MSIPRPRGEQWVRFGVVASFAVLTLVLVLQHVPWRDEADAWLMSRDLGLGELLGRMGYIGSPGLWYLLLAPFAKAGLPYITLGLVNWAIAVAAVAVFVARSPFPWPFQAAFAFSFLVSYEYAVKARSYALAMLLLVLALAASPSRHRRPVLYGLLLALLANTNAHGFVLAAALAALLAAETLRRRALASGLTVAVVGLAAAVVQVLPPADGQMTAVLGSWRPAPEVIPLSLGFAFFPGHQGALWTAAALVVVAAVAWSCARSLRAAVFLAGSLVGLEALFVFIYPGGPRHWGFLMLAAVASLWLAREPVHDGDTRSRRTAAGVWALGLSLLVSMTVATREWWLEWSTDYSAARAMAHFLVSQGLADRPIAAHPAEAATAVLPYLPARRFYYPAIEAWGSHMWWDARQVTGRELSEEELFARVERAIGERDDLLILSGRPLRGADSRGYRLLHAATAARLPDETYYLYGRAGSGQPAPARAGK